MHFSQRNGRRYLINLHVLWSVGRLAVTPSAFLCQAPISDHSHSAEQPRLHSSNNPSLSSPSGINGICLFGIFTYPPPTGSLSPAPSPQSVYFPVELISLQKSFMEREGGKSSVLSSPSTAAAGANVSETRGREDNGLYGSEYKRAAAPGD